MLSIAAAGWIYPDVQEVTMIYSCGIFSDASSELVCHGGARPLYLHIYDPTFIPILSHGYIRLKRVSPKRTSGLSIKDSLFIWEGLWQEPPLLHIERSQLRWLAYPIRVIPGYLPDEVIWAGMEG